MFYEYPLYRYKICFCQQTTPLHADIYYYSHSIYNTIVFLVSFFFSRPNFTYSSLWLGFHLPLPTSLLFTQYQHQFYTFLTSHFLLPSLHVTLSPTCQRLDETRRNVTRLFRPANPTQSISQLGSQSLSRSASQSVGR